MAGFAAILGGAMEGWSESRLDQIKADREARLQELEQQRADNRLASDQKFRSDEAAIGRNFEAGQADKTRAASSSEAQKDRDFRSTEAGKARDASGDLITDDQGNSYSRTGSTAKPLVDDQGKPVKVAGGGKVADKPAEVSTAEWLVQQHVAPDAATAWKMVRSARNDPDKSRASIFKAWMDSLTRGALGAPDPAELQKNAQEMTEKTLQYLGQDDSSGDGGAKSGSGAADVIPPQPADRVVGRTYTNKNGQKAIWKGGGWEIVQ